jgi:hypothetical protein
MQETVMPVLELSLLALAPVFIVAAHYALDRWLTNSCGINAIGLGQWAQRVAIQRATKRNS